MMRYKKQKRLQRITLLEDIASVLLRFLAHLGVCRSVNCHQRRTLVRKAKQRVLLSVAL